LGIAAQVEKAIDELTNAPENPGSSAS
jgi:hypothetical protein